MTKTYKVEMTINIHDGKIVSSYVTNIHEVTAVEKQLKLSADDPDAKIIMNACNRIYTNT